MNALILVADLTGTAVFAAEGAVAATQAHLDLLGILVVGFVTALGGGMLRDVLLGATPPAALRDRRYLFAVLVGAAACLGAGAVLHRGAAPAALLILDAVGLALFAVSGTDKALESGTRVYAAILLGTLTATGGGMVQDLLLNQVPSILRVDFYATAALAGSTLLCLCRRVGVAASVASMLGGACCLLLRLLGAGLHWQLPVPG